MVVTPISAAAVALLVAVAGSIPQPGRVVGDMALTRNPVTVDLTLNGPLREQLAAATASRDTTVRLVVRGVVPPPGGAVTGFDVYLNKTDVTANATVSDDPHWAGSISFHPAGPGSGPQAFALDIGDTLRRLDAKFPAGKPLQVTLVPVGEMMPPDLHIPFREVSVKVVQKTGK